MIDKKEIEALIKAKDYKEFYTVQEALRELLAENEANERNLGILTTALGEADKQIAALQARVSCLEREVQELENLELLLDRLLDYCNNIGEDCADEAIAAGAGLERLYRARKAKEITSND